MLAAASVLDGCLHWTVAAVLGGMLAGAIVGLYSVFTHLVECNDLLRQLLSLARRKEVDHDRT